MSVVTFALYLWKCVSVGPKTGNNSSYRRQSTAVHTDLILHWQCRRLPSELVSKIYWGWLVHRVTWLRHEIYRVIQKILTFFISELLKVIWSLSFFTIYSSGWIVELLGMPESDETWSSWKFEKTSIVILIIYYTSSAQVKISLNFHSERFPRVQDSYKSPGFHSTIV